MPAVSAPPGASVNVLEYAKSGAGSGREFFAATLGLTIAAETGKEASFGMRASHGEVLFWSITRS